MDDFAAELWDAVCEQAQAAQLDTSLFGDAQREVIVRVAHFLAQSPVRRSLLRSTTKPISPIILYGPPGTGKTTFLYVLDRVLREKYGLPDGIRPKMQKRDRTYSLQKRMLGKETVSLLSVSQWSQLLHFYEWDVRKHKLVPRRLQQFIDETVVPMRVILADEVEMVGYSPTIPTLAKNGILVVGTSNQTEFAQLERQQISPHKIFFGGVDMRKGDPQDAVISAEELPIINQLTNQKPQVFGQVTCQLTSDDRAAWVRLDFGHALSAPLLDVQWVNFIETTRFFVSDPTSLTQNRNYVLLLDNFSLRRLRRDYNGIIRFIALFDAVEQLGIGVLLRNMDEMLNLSRESFEELKRVIEAADDASEDVKRKTLVGIDRFTSRLGMAGQRAKALL